MYKNKTRKDVKNMTKKEMKEKILKRLEVSIEEYKNNNSENLFYKEIIYGKVFQTAVIAHELELISAKELTEILNGIK